MKKVVLPKREKIVLSYTPTKTVSGLIVTSRNNIYIQHPHSTVHCNYYQFDSIEEAVKLMGKFSLNDNSTWIAVNLEDGKTFLEKTIESITKYQIK